MAKYTYEDIIIDPTSEEAKNAVGKEVYFADTPAGCLNAAKNNNKAYLGYLKKLVLGDEEQPFHVNEFVVSAPSSWTCIILKKEEPKPKYVPFKNGLEFFNSYLSVESRLEKTDYFLSNHGIWLKDKDIDDVFYIVTEIWKDGVVLGSDQSTTKWDDLLCGYTFLDSTPCGKLMEE